jgi:hypothetical protein
MSTKTKSTKGLERKVEKGAGRQAGGLRECETQKVIYGWVKNKKDSNFVS